MTDPRDSSGPCASEGWRPATWTEVMSELLSGGAAPDNDVPPVVFVVGVEPCRGEEDGA